MYHEFELYKEGQSSARIGVVLKLHEALGIAPGDVVAFVGAGGKSGAILTVSDGLAQAGMKVLVAPTTKMLLGEATE